MRSFSLLALAAAVLAPFVGAAPAPVVDAVAVAAGVGHVNARVAGARAVDGTAADVHVRSPTLPVSVPVANSVVNGVEDKLQVRGQKCLQAILIDVKVEISVDIEALNCLTASNATVEVITPIIKDIVSILSSAVVELKALVGEDITVILASVDGTAQVTVSIIAELVAEILCLIFHALSFVSGIVVSVTVLINILVDVGFGGCLCEFLDAVFCLVDGLLTAVVPLVVDLTATILALGLDAVGKTLTLC